MAAEGNAALPLDRNAFISFIGIMPFLASSPCPNQTMCTLLLPDNLNQDKTKQKHSNKTVKMVGKGEGSVDLH